MKHPWFPPYSIIVWYVTALHTWYAGAIVFDANLGFTTANYPFYALCGERPWVASLGWGMGVGGVALLFYTPWRWWYLYLGMPQQIILICAAIGTIYFAAAGRYADGTPHDGFFILTDQLPSVATAIFHFFGLIAIHTTHAHRRML